MRMSADYYWCFWSARLLIKYVKEDTMGNVEFTKVLFLRISLRLGKDVFTLGEISEEYLARRRNH